jgi:hypothetical protein
MTPEMTRGLVASILQHPHDHNWSIQGLGMLRTFLGSEHYRLHVWSTADATPNVSRLHDHPWHFTSYVVAGLITNKRFRVCTDDNRELAAETWQRVRIRCGPEGGVAGEPELAHLMREKPEKIMGGQWYAQQAQEVHESIPDDGTVSIIRRTSLDDPDHANVYFPVGQPWVSAGGARVANAQMVGRICKNALDRVF